MYTALPSTITDNHETECSNPISYDEWFKLVLKYCVYYGDPNDLCEHTKQMLETIYNCYLSVYEGGKYFILYSYEATKDDV